VEKETLGALHEGGRKVKGCLLQSEVKWRRKKNGGGKVYYSTIDSRGGQFEKGVIKNWDRIIFSGTKKKGGKRKREKRKGGGKKREGGEGETDPLVVSVSGDAKEKSEKDHASASFFCS